MQHIEIKETTVSSIQLLESVNSLIKQLSSTANPMTADSLEQLVASSASRLFVARIGKSIVGMYTLAFYNAPTGCKAWIEDVVVDNAFRRQHVGRKLIEHAIEEARKHSPCTLMLTSRSARIAANCLYIATGFIPKNTNVYKMTL